MSNWYGSAYISAVRYIRSISPFALCITLIKWLLESFCDRLSPFEGEDRNGLVNSCLDDYWLYLIGEAENKLRFLVAGLVLDSLLPDCLTIS